MPEISERWNYVKGGGLNYPVEHGQVWGVGMHKVACDDMNKRRAWLMSAVGSVPCTVFVDPPWNMGNVNSFRTKAGLEHEGGGQPAFRSFLAGLCATLKALEPRVAAIEMGVDATPDLRRTLRDYGAVVLGDWPMTYYRRHPCRLVLASWNLPLAGREEPTAIQWPSEVPDDEDAPKILLDQVPEGVVVDPCAGRGLIAVTAASLGKRFVGCELSPRRTSVTLTKLAKATGQTPRLITE